MKIKLNTINDLKITITFQYNKIGAHKRKKKFITEPPFLWAPCL